ncbi:energy transducer TonB [Aurantiacibacter xanthus]|uniref:Energy transducer TonB n=1 Tax=Aurantiacibacter xanthus TaxID=1784712 RepID=A0A3A1PEN5_9SPHN|nr:energy transducer TonB [Aurantiacibacter xanthus]RIV92253.1 energy transducer TonB [Aurantiacibacter xanthus]
MAYVDSTAAPGARAKALLGVGAIHAVMAIGVYTGLTITGVIAPPEKIVTAWNVPTPTPTLEPPPPEKIEQQVPEVVTYNPPKAPERKLDLPTRDPIVAAPFDDGPVMPTIPRQFPGTGTGDLALPTPSPSPSFAAVGPSAINGPTGWITTDDYPRRDLMRENEGTVRYRLVVASNGRVETCEVTQSSGHSGLDAETCRLLQRRARFQPAKDTSGAQVVGTFTGAVTWQIP